MAVGEMRPVPPPVVHVGSPSDLCFEGSRLVDGEGRTVSTRPLTVGWIIALHAARSISSEEAAALTVARMPPPVEPMPTWVAIALGLVLGFIAGEARLSCLESSIPHAVTGVDDGR